MGYKGYFVDLARGNHCDRGTKNSGGNKRQRNMDLRTRRMEPGKELGALFGVFVPDAAEKAETVRAETQRVRREEVEARRIKAVELFKRMR